MTSGEAPTRVVLVDDHEMFAESLARILGAETDIEVVGREGTMAEAVELCASACPDIVIVDYQLPDGDGVETSRRVLAGCDPPPRVLMLTGLPDERVLVAAIDAGCSGFVTKDNAVSELVHAVRLIEAGEAYIAPRMLGQLLPRFGTKRRGVGSDLTSRESDVLRLIALGRTNQAIADELFVSVHTVRNHVQNILSKLNAHSKLEAAAIATREGLLQ